jgi:hypothetical protein
MTAAELRAAAGALTPDRRITGDEQAVLAELLDQAAERVSQLEEIEGMLPRDPRARPVVDRVRGVLRALASSVELLDAETAREVPAATLRRRRAMLLDLLPRLGPFRPPREARTTARRAA